MNIPAEAVEGEPNQGCGNWTIKRHDPLRVAVEQWREKMKATEDATPAEAVNARRTALIAELWPKNQCSYNELSDWAQAYVDQAIAKEGASDD